ncbi:MAG: ABC transporter permease [Pseudomonadota bacterium]|jgi:hypothetical protein|nr:ABC transporter permease [Pseudomonadota bacterium]MDE3141404.1 ABC transporter permease [Pseudomonadota bacterium]
MKNRILAYCLVGIALAAVIFSSALLRGMSDAHIPGASPDRRYFALGVETDQGVHYQQSTDFIGQMAQRLPPALAIATTAMQGVRFALADGARKQKVAPTDMVSARYFQAVDLSHVLGSVISPAEVHANAPVVMINRILAKRLFGSARAALGRDVLAGGEGTHAAPLRIVGVVTNSFHGLYGALWRENQAYAWVPLPYLYTRWGNKWPPNVNGMDGLLSAPASMPMAEIRHDVDVAWQRLPQSVVAKGSRGVVLTQPFTMDPHDVAATAHRLKLYLGLAIAALLVTVINLVAMDFLRILQRRGVRALERTLGATRVWQLQRVLYRALLGALLTMVVTGVLLGAAAIFAQRTIAAFGHRISIWMRVVRDLDLVHLLVVALLAALVLAVMEVLLEAAPLLPDARALTASRVSTPRSERTLGGGVLAIEFTLAAFLVVLALWGATYAVRMARVNLGMLQGQRLTLLSMEYKSGLHSWNSASHTLLVANLQRAISGVEPHAHVGVGPVVGFAYRHGAGNFRVLHPVEFTAGRAGIAAQGFAASSGWLRAGEVQLLAGRNFSSDNQNPRDILIDAQVARALFGSAQAAIGRLMYKQGGRKPYRVRGVIAPLRMHGPARDAVASYILPLHGWSNDFDLGGGQILIRPAIPVARYAALHAAVQRVFAKEAPYLQVGQIQSSTQVLNRIDRPQRVLAMVFGTVAGFALLIALTGLVVFLRLFLVMRKRVDAIRQALGASPRRLYTGVVVGTVLLGGAGAVLALLFTPWLAQQFALLSGAQVAPFGPATWVALAVLLLAVFLVAHFPARRAARAEPAESLHEL